MRTGRLNTIALDAMGSDHAPQVEVEGAPAVRAGGVRALRVGDGDVLAAAGEG